MKLIAQFSNSLSIAACFAFYFSLSRFPNLSFSRSQFLNFLFSGFPISISLPLALFLVHSLSLNSSFAIGICQYFPLLLPFFLSLSLSPLLLRELSLFPCRARITSLGGSRLNSVSAHTSAGTIEPAEMRVMCALWCMKIANFHAPRRTLSELVRQKIGGSLFLFFTFLDYK